MAIWGGPNIPRLERERNVTALLAALQHKRAKTRIEAAGALGRLRDATAVEPLCALLRDADPLVRTAAAEAIAGFNDDRVIEALGQALTQEKESAVRAALVTALGGAQNPRALEFLGAAFRRGETRYAAGEQLERLHAVDQLITLLSDGDKGVRYDAARVLGKIGDLRATEALVTALADPDWSVRWFAAIALAQFADPRAGAPYSEDAKAHKGWQDRWFYMGIYGAAAFSDPTKDKLFIGSNAEKGMAIASMHPEPLVRKFGSLMLGHSVSTLPRAVTELLITAIDEALMPEDEAAQRKAQVGAAAFDAVATPLLAWVRKTALDLLLQRMPPAQLEGALNTFLSDENETIRVLGTAGLKLLHERMAESQDTSATTDYREHVEQRAKQFGVAPTSKEALQAFNPADIPPEVTGIVIAFRYLVASGAKTHAEAAAILSQSLRALGASERYIEDALQYAVAHM